jgi:hypothetical protein
VNQGNPVYTRLVTWEEVRQAIIDNDLDDMSLYIRDFSNLLQSMYKSSSLTFSFAEVRAMYDTNVPTSIRKLIQVIEGVANGLEKNGHKVIRLFEKRWFEDQYVFNIQYNGQDVLWFGLWTAYWEKSGVPLCFGVGPEYIDKRICEAFKNLHPTCVTFTESTENHFVENIEKAVLLSTTPVEAILNILEQDLQHLCQHIM